ncbi:MAG: aminopeptidase P family protein [Candidatus Omnitrophica bacterium]|nr:aminopeptidase P family protein [Candidatus Omnitrophota bacterium]
MSAKRPRVARLLRGFAGEGIDALLVSAWPNVTYLSGFKGSESWLVVSPKALYFITDSRYAEQAASEARGFRLVLRDKKNVVDILADLAKAAGFKKLGFESSAVSHAFYARLERTLGADRLVPTDGMVEKLREIKDREEIRLIRKSVGIAVQGFHYIREIVRPGMSEREAQGRLEHYTKSLGSEKPAFDIIIATGPRSSMPHCRTDETPIMDHQPVLVDMGVVYGGYHSDLTRPVFLGRMSPLHRKIHRIVRQAQLEGIKTARPGVPAREVDAACRRVIERCPARPRPCSGPEWSLPWSPGFISPENLECGLKTCF